MGGEKLHLLKPYLCVFLAGLFFFTGLFNAQFTLSAQTAEDPELSAAGAEAPNAGVPAIDESSIILGEAPVVPPPSGASSIFIVFRMVLVLALAALAIYGVVFFIKRLARPRETADPYLKVLARTVLSSDTFAAVLAVGSKAWLVAGGPGGINLISEIDDNETLETMMLEEERRAAESGAKTFIDFRSLLSKFGAPGRVAKIPSSHAKSSSITESGSLAESLRRQRERLRGP